jgi:hypothetical protein
MGDRWGPTSGPGYWVLFPKGICSSIRWKHAFRIGCGPDGHFDTLEQKKVGVELVTGRRARLVPHELPRLKKRAASEYYGRGFATPQNSSVRLP